MQPAMEQVDVELRPFNGVNATRDATPGSAVRRCAQALCLHDIAQGAAQKAYKSARGFNIDWVPESQPEAALSEKMHAASRTHN